MSFDSNALQWTAAQLLSDVRRKASLPVTSTDFSDAVLLRECTDVLWSFAGWAMAQAGEGRLIATLDRLLSSGTLTGAYRAASEVDLPPLAIADSIDGVTYIDQNGATQARLQRLESGQESDYDTPLTTGTPSAYALVGGRIRLYPQPTTGGTLRISYQRRHPELIVDNTTNVGTVVSGTGTTTTVLTMALAWPLAVAGNEVDIISATSPYRTLASGVTVASNVTTTLTLSAPFANLVNLGLAGARVVLAGQSPYVQFPLEFRACVTEKTAANVMRILGDAGGNQLAEQAALMELARVTQLLSPRAKRDKPKAVSPYSHIRGRMARWGRW